MNFNKEVLDASKTQLVIVDFWADWCHPCKILSPVLESLTKEYKFKLVKKIYKLKTINTIHNPIHTTALFTISNFMF